MKQETRNAASRRAEKQQIGLANEKLVRPWTAKGCSLISSCNLQELLFKRFYCCHKVHRLLQMKASFSAHAIEKDYARLQKLGQNRRRVKDPQSKTQTGTGKDVLSVLSPKKLAEWVPKFSHGNTIINLLKLFPSQFWWRCEVGAVHAQSTGRAGQRAGQTRRPGRATISRGPASRTGRTHRSTGHADEDDRQGTHSSKTKKY